MTTTAIPTSLPKTHGSNRSTLVAGGTLTILLALLSMVAAVDSYDMVLRHFQSLAMENSVKVDAALDSLRYMAEINKYAADLMPHQPESSKWKETSLKLLKSFEAFRAQAFVLRSSLTGKDLDTYNELERRVYNDYWPLINRMIQTTQQGNRTEALVVFDKAYQLYSVEIAGRFVQLQQTNYKAMLTAKHAASIDIQGRAVWLGLLTAGLALALTWLSFWLRNKLRRVLTPGLDTAVLVSWVMVMLLFSQLNGLPTQLERMVEDAYYSIAAAGRVVAQANEANVTESAALNDPKNAKEWQQRFDNYASLVALRMCGQTDCLSQPFTPIADVMLTTVAERARAIKSTDSDRIEGFVPLAANVTFADEATTLERARQAFNTYLAYDSKMRAYLASGQITEAALLNTGDSDKAFLAFVTQMEREEQINRDMFNNMWTSQRVALPAFRTTYGILGFLLIMALIAAGVYHRYREL